MYSLPLTGFPVWETVSWPQVLTCFSEVGSHLEIWKVSKGYGQSASCSWPPSSPHLSCLPRVLWEWKSPPRHLSFPQVSHSGEPPTLNCPGLFCAWTFRDKTAQLPLGIHTMHSDHKICICRSAGYHHQHWVPSSSSYGSFISCCVPFP